MKKAIDILQQRIKYLQTNMKLTKNLIFEAQSHKDFKAAIANMENYEKENYALFELRKLEEDLKNAKMSEL